MLKIVRLRAATGNPNEIIILFLRHKDHSLKKDKTKKEVKAEDAKWLLEFIRHFPNNTVTELMRLLREKHPEMLKNTEIL